MKTRYDAFCDRVIARIPRATAREREQIRQELLDHMEDRDLDLRQRGWTAEEAAEKTVAAMGDADEIGKSWNDQLSPFWLWTGRLARLAALCLILVALLPAIARVAGVSRNLWAQWSDLDNHRYGFQEAASQWELDERVEMGDYELRFYHAGLFPVDMEEAIVREPCLPEFKKGVSYYKMVVMVAGYSKNPLYSQPNNIWTGLGEPWRDGGCTILSDAVRYQQLSCYVEKGTEQVRLGLDNDHGSADITFDLEWGEDG